MRWLLVGIVTVVACAGPRSAPWTPPTHVSAPAAAPAPAPPAPAPAPPPTTPPPAPPEAPVDPLRARIEVCDHLGFEIEDLIRLPDAVELALSDKERVALARVLRADMLSRYGEREAKVEGAALDHWIAAGAPMELLQAVPAVDPARRGGKELAWIVVVAFDHPRWGSGVAIAGRSKKRRWIAILTGDHPTTRALALGDRDGDGWTDILLDRPRRGSAATELWWATSRPGTEIRTERNRLGGRDEVGRKEHLLLGVFPECPR